jgi:hypothetical protein
MAPPSAGRRGGAAAGVALLAVAALGSGSSTDGVRLGVPGAVNNSVSLAAAGSDVVVAWAARSGAATDVYAAWSRDGGGIFGAPARVNDVAGDARVSGEQAPRVALGASTEVVWVSRQDGASVVRAAKARAGERSFEPATTVHAAGLTGARGWASLAVGPDQAVHVAWLDGREAQAARASAPAAGHAGHKGMRQDLYQAVSWPDGTRFETRIATDVCFCCKTGVATAPDGTVYVAWRHIYPPNLRDMAVARSTDGGRTFAPPVRVSEDGWALDGCPDDGPSIAVDARGAVHVAWPTLVPGSDSGKGIFYSYSLDGGRTFAARVRLDEGTGAGHPQLAVGGDRVVVVWDQSHEGRRRIVGRALSSDPRATAWTPVLGRPAVLSAERPAVYPAVAATPTSTVVAWTEETRTGSEIRVRRLRQGLVDQ